MATFHAGEIEVQQRAGVRVMAQRIGRSIHPTMPPPAQGFLSVQNFVVIGGADSEGQVWASLLSGPEGFVHALDERNVRIETLPVEGDPLREALREQIPAGLIALEPTTRRRMRLNGMASIQDNGLLLKVNQAYSNCPKYIQKRELQSLGSAQNQSSTVTRQGQLSSEQTRFIQNADTFFIVTQAANSADASHRGGNAGFVYVKSEKHLAFPDYPGNAMFNTLGNIQANPQVGLLFIDWENGDTLQLSGTARVNWDVERMLKFESAERVVEFEVDAVVSIQGAISWNWEFIEASPYNP